MARTNNVTFTVTPAQAKLLAEILGEAPAKPVTRSTRKAAVKAPNSGDVAWNGKKGDRTRWNNAVTTNAKTSGLRDKKNRSLYSRVIKEWKTTITQAREAGMTPNEALQLVKFTPANKG